MTTNNAVVTMLASDIELQVNEIYREEDLQAMLRKSVTTNGSTELPEKYRSLPSTSAKIRAMNADGYSNTAITKMLKYADGRNLRYQHVHNVLSTPLKKA